MTCVLFSPSGNSLKSWWTGIASNPTSKPAPSSSIPDDSLQQETGLPAEELVNLDVETTSGIMYQSEQIQGDIMQSDGEKVGETWDPLYNSNHVN
jgi:hypothetical protein